jgi:RNA polymerase sigma factor (sigma-70 family)
LIGFSARWYWGIVKLGLISGGRERARGEAASPAPRSADDLAPMVAAARAGSASALRTLVSTVGPAILKTLRRVLGARHPELEDAAQESSFAFVTALGGFRGECSTLHFACRIAVLTALKRRRAEPPPAGALPDDDHPAAAALPGGGQTPLAALVSARRRAVLRDLFRDLPEQQAEALALHLVLGHSIEEVAAAVGAPGNTVRSRIRLGKEALRARIAGDGRLAELLSVSEEEQEGEK